jgi:uncharacterized protein
MKKSILSIILVLVIFTQSFAESSVWKLQKGGSVIYLGGTCHLLRRSDFPLPTEFDTAYRASDILVFETDIDKFNNPTTQQELILKAMYADGSTIDRHLTSKTYNLLKEYCASKGIPLEGLKQFKPSIIAVTMATTELAQIGVTQEGVDTYFYKLATRDNKQVEVLETVEEQIRFIVGMGKGNEDAFITHAINDMKSVKRQYESLVNAWEKGDAKKLNDLMVSELKTNFPKVYKELLTDRNENWLPMIDVYQETPQIEFILVGVGHLVGPAGIVEALRQKGYTIEKL